MSSPYFKAKAVLGLYRRLESQMLAYKDATGLKCISGCYHCCTKPDIEAYPIEFLPFAYDIYKNGTISEWYERVKAENSPVCSFLKPFHQDQQGGGCSQYAYRGLICRLFAFAARKNKYGDPQLVACKPMKEQTPEIIRRAEENIQLAPLFSEYYSTLRFIEPRLSETTLPINRAILTAMEYVMAYYAYRPGRPLKRAS